MYGGSPVTRAEERRRPGEELCGVVVLAELHEVRHVVDLNVSGTCMTPSSGMEPEWRTEEDRDEVLALVVEAMALRRNEKSDACVHVLRSRVV